MKTFPYYIEVMLEVNNEVYPDITSILQNGSYIIISNDDNIVVGDIDKGTVYANFLTSCDDKSYYEITLYVNLEINEPYVEDLDYIKEHIDVGFCIGDVELSDYTIISIKKQFLTH